MMSEDTYYSLKEKYDETKQQLVETNFTIRRLTGRSPDDVPNDIPGLVSKYRPSAVGESRKRVINTKRYQYPENPASEESPSSDESPSKKPTVQSRVVAKHLQAKSRKATIDDQNATAKIKARNRRMFGALIGTLEKFKTEEKKRENVVSMKAQIEQKVEAATEEERERIKKEKEMLFVTRREKQIELRCLEKKLERSETHKVFEEAHEKMLNFMKTKAMPPIFFLPTSHTPVSKQYFEEARKELKALLDLKKAELDADLKEIEDSYQKNADSVPTIASDKEDDCPKDDTESQDVPEIETGSLICEQEDTDPEEKDESNIDIRLGDSLSDPEFVPIYD